MNFNAIERSFSQITNLLGGGVIALILALLVLGVIVFFIFRSGKQLRIRIPFLPRGMNVIKIGKDDLKPITGIGGFGSGSENAELEQQHQEKAVVKRLFSAIDSLSGNIKKRYELPLYVLVSQYPSSSALIEDAGRDILESLEIKDVNGSPSGNCVILSRGGLIYHDTPEVLVDELIESRPERPLDGVVFVIPVSDLMIKDARERRARIDWIFKQYWLLQSRVEFNFPVYFIISEIEQLEGYTDFWSREGVRSQLDEVFGWSNPYNVDSQFDSRMLDEAFTQINEVLEKEIERVVNGEKIDNDEILLFPQAIRKLLSPVKEFANGILNSSSLIHQPKFRGIYFTGRLKVREQEKHMFLERLFVDKIFPERSLASPTSDRLLSADRGLRRLQIFWGSLLVVAMLWIIYDVIEVAIQGQNIERMVQRVDAIWREEDEYDAIAPSFDLLADVNASPIYCCGPIPWSWVYSPNKEIVTFFQENLFTQKIFPVMECKSRQQIFNLVKLESVGADGRLIRSSFDDWVDKLLSEATTYSRVRYLMGDISYRSEQSIADEFSNVIFDLFGKALPEGFENDAELYIKAIGNKEYSSSSLSGHYCARSVQDAESIWSIALTAATHEISNEVTRITAPLDFIRQILAFESGSLERGPIDREQFSDYVEWNKHVEKVFDAGNENGFCVVASNKLERLSISLNAFGRELSEPQSGIQAFKSLCQESLAEQMEFDNTQLPRPLYSSVRIDDEFAPQISTDAGRVFALIGELSDFTFSSVQEETWTNKESFFWSVDLLAQSLSYADEYFRYTEGRFETPYLPESPTKDRQNYLAQAVALAQLQRAMLSTIEESKFDSLSREQIDFSTLDMKEARIADRVANFKKALNPLLALLSTFEQLGLTSAKRKLLIQAHGQASNLLEEVDRLFESNRIYEPKPNPSWTAKNYPEAFYGLLTEDSAKDYLFAQVQRSQILARDYAQPLVIFLANTEGGFEETEILSKWKQTLVQLNKRQNKDPSNDIELFEQFFLGDFFATDYGNCHENIKKFNQATGNSVFALRWRELEKFSSDQCMRLRADTIKREYLQVTDAFNKFLAPFYPFNSKEGAKPLSPNNLRAFSKVYSGESNGLAERVRVLAWKNQRFSPAEGFLRELDSSLAILNEVIESSSASGSGISIEATFNPDVEMVSEFDVSNHISSKRLYAGKSATEFPGKTSSLQWKFSDETGFDLDWASGSPYSLFSEDGKAADGTLSFESNGYWSLIRFIESYKSEKIDSTTLDEESMLLEFKMAIQKSSISSEMTPIDVFVRVTLFGIDPETQSPKALRFPNSFPKSAPLSS